MQPKSVLVRMRQLKITKSITNRESASLDKYLQEIGREDLITVEEDYDVIILYYADRLDLPVTQYGAYLI